MWKKVELTGLTPVASLEGTALDWAVTLAEYPNTEHDVWRNFRSECHYWTDWAQGGPIIEREKMTLEWTGEDWMAYIRHDEEYFGPTPLIAAMRCFVASKLGDEVEVPDELLQS
jgi:hypothetical protein